MEAPALLSPTTIMDGATRAVLTVGAEALRARDVGACGLISFTNISKENAMSRPIALGLAMLAGIAIGTTAVKQLHAQNKAPGTYAVLDLRAINSPDVFKTIPSKTGDFEGHTA
jgi:hypothetical protein